jgi:predicted patatin/cPLA2 family phospholipase
MSEGDNHRKKRSLILAGGGIKVAFQAGVLQVWLDEAGLTFDHADGASGGTFNLAMYCQGMSGAQIADNWRNLSPYLGVDFNLSEYGKLFYAESLFKLDRYREKVFPGWGLDWDRIRASEQEAIFNVYNFSKHELEVLTPDRMTEDYLAACVSLPMWFPPVIIDGDTYIDPVFITDANLEEAIRRGADELWIIWTVSERSEWNDGFVANYFQIIETSVNGHFKRSLRRIEENNAAIAEGRPGEFGRRIEVKMLKAEVPLHYLVNLSSDRLKEAVNRG